MKRFQTIASIKIAGLLGVVLSLAACVHNDIPYPTVYGNFVEFEVKGQVKQAAIDTLKGTLVVYLGETVSMDQVTVEKCQITDRAMPKLEVKITPDPIKPGDILDLTTPKNYMISTYENQNYEWTISAVQEIERKFVVRDQVGTEQIDVANKSVLVQVPETTPLDQITVMEAKLGPSDAETSPDPLSVTDFTNAQTFTVTYRGVTETWSVRIIQTSILVTTDPADAWTKRAYLHGTGQVGETHGFKMKKSGAAEWTTVDPATVVSTGATFTAMIPDLQPQTSYVYMAISGPNEGEEVTFTTSEAAVLPNASFEEWHKDGKVWNPWLQTGTKYWDTGNRGATIASESITVPSTEVAPGVTGQSAKLESKWVKLKFAAGNIFFGEYVKTDGTNGILTFGRPFVSHPSKLKGKFRYTPAAINRASDENPDLRYLLGRPDSCNIYIALSDANQPFDIRTKPSERILFEKDHPNVIAYGNMVSGTSTNGQWLDFTIDLDYRATNRVPKYLIVVATASKHGDYFTGGEGSVLYLDELELVYE